jgi:hypothetical protein
MSAYDPKPTCDGGAKRLDWRWEWHDQCRYLASSGGVVTAKRIQLTVPVFGLRRALQRHVTGVDAPLDCRGGRTVEFECVAEHT